ncbi:MAG: Omp28-related outer membrane protein, partial [bacterium]|nr:Omp28-related outer membrane protein [bacterium]
MIDDYEEDINVIRYHTWWPGGHDPFYNFNITESRARISYYNVTGIPWAALDGTDAGWYTGWENRFLSRLNVQSPLEIGIFGTFNYETREVELNVGVTATDVIEFENLRFFCILVENDLSYGSRTYNQVMRDMVPNGVGSGFVISEGETVNFERSFVVDEDIYEDNCWILSFVQNSGSKEILQSTRVELTGIPTSVDEFPQGYIPSTVSLLQNYPNPFNASTNITFDLREKADVNLSVYNVAGQKVADIANGKFEAGSHTVNWD